MFTLLISFIITQTTQSVSLLHVKESSSYIRIWTDAGTGSKKDGAFWKPELKDDEIFISFVNTVSYTTPSEKSIIISPPFPENALSSPISLIQKWSDKGSGGKQDVFFYRPIPATNYICFGDYISTTKVASASNDYKCLHKTYVKQIFDGNKIAMWNDRGSGADQDGSVWKFTTNNKIPEQYYLTNSGYNAPDLLIYSLNNYVVGTFNCVNLNDQVLRLSFARKFAPIAKFDRAAANYGYPMNAQTYIDMGGINGPNSNFNNNDINKAVTYFDIELCDGVYKIIYWWFYGYQNKCTSLTDEGSHPGDWERIIIHLSDCNTVKQVTYFQHGGHYTLDKTRIEFLDNKVVTYVGKIAHGNYHDRNTDSGYTDCGYFNDFRNPSSSLTYLYTSTNLIDLDYSQDNWIKNNIHICCANPLTLNICQYNSDCDDTGCCWYTCGNSWSNRWGSDAITCAVGDSQCTNKNSGQKIDNNKMKVENVDVKKIVVYGYIIVGIVIGLLFSLLVFVVWRVVKCEKKQKTGYQHISSSVESEISQMM